MEAAVKILCVGDIHLGRQSSRLPSQLLEHPGARALGPTGAWERTVAFATHARADAVLLAGDVVEQEDDFYEAYGDLRKGVEQLTAAGISVLAVAGNHDVKVLPRLAETVPGFRLLGRGGCWEVADLEGREGALTTRVVGWSFPAPHVRSDPLSQGVPMSREGASRLIGLLHCDRDALGSSYAPVRTRELEDVPTDAWLLGHIHKPDPLSPPRPIGYLGSLTGLDPGEQGPRGPWLLEITTSGVSISHMLLAPLRWEEVQVDVTGVEHDDQVHRAIISAIDSLHDRVTVAPVYPAAVGCRLRLTGRNDQRGAIERRLRSEDPRALVHVNNGITYFVHDWGMAVLPAFDLAELAKGRDPAGLLARKILALRDDGGSERRQLVADTQRRLEGVTTGRNFTLLNADVPNEAVTAEILERAALRALDALLQQRSLET
jgi:3',5'-cyclic AMP phosphodiesterase CpdA